MTEPGSNRTKILVVEDQASMAELLRKGLEDQSYAVTVARTGTEGLALARRESFAAIVLDIILPGLDGQTLTMVLRAESNHTPILMLTARDLAENIAEGLDAGAEDYLTKPFSFIELLARLRVLIRRKATPLPELLKVADLTLDTTQYIVSRGGVEIALTKKEFLLLQTLMESAGQVVLRSEIIKRVWGSIDSIEQGSLDVYMKMLRSKVDTEPGSKMIYTVRGFGYKLLAP